MERNEVQRCDHQEAFTLLEVELDLTLASLPDPKTCGFCGSRMQREFMRWEERTGGLLVFCDELPGYGCTGCGVKERHPDVFYHLLTAAAAMAASSSDEAGSWLRKLAGDYNRRVRQRIASGSAVAAG
jgi:hypothetical protein